MAEVLEMMKKQVGKNGDCGGGFLGDDDGKNRLSFRGVKQSFGER